MKNFNFFQLLIGSFYNPEVYRDAVGNKKGSTFGYLFFLVVICTIPLMISIFTGMNTFLKDDGKFIIDQVPEITFSDGHASMKEASPYFIKTKEGNAIIAIDLSDSAQITELQGDTRLLLTRSKLIAQQKENETRTYDLSKVTNFTLNASKINFWLGYAWIVYILIFVCILICLYIYRLLQALVNGIFGLIISAIIKVNLDYTALLYISLVAITPVAILASVLWATDLNIPAKGWLGFILAIGYIGFGINANKPQPVSNLNEYYENELPPTQDPL